MTETRFVGTKDGNTVLQSVSATDLPVATNAAAGAVIPDGTIITVDGSGNITVPKATSAVFGVGKVDNVTVKATAGVLSALPQFPATSGSPGTSPAAGTAMWDSATGILYIYNGTIWKTVTSV